MTRPSNRPDFEDELKGYLTRYTAPHPPARRHPAVKSTARVRSLVAGTAGLAALVGVTAVALVAHEHSTARSVAIATQSQHVTAATSVGAGASSSLPAPTATSLAPTLAPFAPVGWISYVSTAQHVAFAHPANWTVVCDSPNVNANWLLVDTTGASYHSCPQGDSPIGILVASAPGTAQPTGLSLISSSPGLYSNVKQTSVTVAGVTGTRFSADQTQGMGTGSSQVEYDFTTGGRTYSVLAVVGGVKGVTTATAAQVDQFVQTFTFAG